MGFKVCAVVSNDSIVSGLGEPLLYQEAKKDNLMFISNDQRNEDRILSVIKEKHVDYLLSVQHIWVLSKNLLDAVKEAYNIHNAKLPEYKGYYSISHAILNGDKTYTSTAHYMIPKVDSGDIIFEKSVPIEENDTAKSLYDKTIESCKFLADKLINHVANGWEIPRKKIEGEGKFYNKASLDKYKVMEPEQITKQIVCAMYFPPQTARIKLKGETYALSL